MKYLLGIILRLFVVASIGFTVAACEHRRSDGADNLYKVLNYGKK